MVTVLTDNKNRSFAEIRKIFEGHGGRIGEAGSAAYIFKDPEKPSFLVPVSEEKEARRLLALASALDEHDDVQDVYSNFDVPESLINNG
jgi:transcriptional/translational regulatory protein YebC/TACO1